MRNLAIALAACGSVLILGSCDCSYPEADPTDDLAESGGCNATPFGETPLLPQVPCVPDFSGLPNPPDVQTLQVRFDEFSWKTFIGLSWPALRGSSDPDPAIRIGARDASTVWESWKGAWEIFLPDGSRPAPWGTQGELPPECRGLGDEDELLPYTGKVPKEVLDAFGEPFKTGPLIDQNGHFARFEILVNEPMFDYIVAHQLYNQQGQKAFAGEIDFPGDASNTQPQLEGAIMVKAAWKVISAAERSRFHSKEALVFTPASADPPIAATCKRQMVGLVGFHIAHKTQSDPQWLWSTFEHVANAPQRDELPATGSFNFYDPGCESCPVNEPPAKPWDPNAPPDPKRAVQVVREIGITPDAAGFTSTFHAELAEVNADSVWLNYELISTQWPTNAQDPTDPTGAPAPQFLANTTLETYIQGRVPNVSSNCIECHKDAYDTQGTPADFTYLLQLAKPEK